MTGICACNYRSVKMLLVKLGSELLNVFINIQSALKMWIKCRVNFLEVECTGVILPAPTIFPLIVQKW